MPGMNDSTSDLVANIDSESQYSSDLAKSYQEKYKGKSLEDREKESPEALALKFHQYPMDPPEIQNFKIQVIKQMPNPKKAWVAYYAGGYARKFGLKNQSMSDTPGQIAMVADSKKVDSILEE